MAFGLKLRRVPKAEIDEKVRGAAQMLGIEDLLDRKPKALSGGQRQRVAVGRAIVRTPKAFLFDEPLSNLDAKLRVEMRAELKKLHRKLCTTTIYVTHDQEEAMTLGDRVVVMKDGVIHQVASPLEVYESPVNRFVAGFVGTPPMNFLNVQVAAGDGGLYLDEGSGRLRLNDRMSRQLADRVGQTMVLGVRPESLSFRPDGRYAGGENQLNVTIGVVETLGDKMDVYVQTPVHPHIVCRVESSRDLKDGIDLPVYLDMDQVHLFEPGEDGVNVSLNGKGDQVSAA
jgi:multiple sugar transport system ATP-binding protein